MKNIPAACLLAAIAAICACSSTKADTAEEFVKKHAKANYFRDAEAAAGMTLCAEDLEKVSLPARVELEVAETKRDTLKAELQRQMKSDDVWVKAWEDTRYVSEQDHGDHVHVSVKVGYANSSIVLVRVGKHLKIAPNPSSFE
jgi:hypothetical protein